MEDRRKYLKMKFIMSIVSTVLIMVITGSLIGMTFAWFSSSAVPQTATIVLETNKVFTLTFTSVAGGSTYKGQSALDPSNGKIITQAPANESEPNNYPFTLRNSITISTENTLREINVKFSHVDISNSTRTLNEGRTDAESAPYGFTWYFTDTSQDNVYTPYGTISKVSGVYTLVSDNIQLQCGNGSEGETFLFYIVFAPERLYWLSQFANVYHIDNSIPCNGGNMIPGVYPYTSTNVYSESEQNKIVAEGFPNQVYYSTVAYIGCKFEFDIEMVANNVA